MLIHVRVECLVHEKKNVIRLIFSQVCLINRILHKDREKFQSQTKTIRFKNDIISPISTRCTIVNL